MVKIKICGITNLDEIKYLNILKPDYVGFVFTKSKRQISINNVKKLIQLLDSSIKTVGVFKDNKISEILEILFEVNLDVVQLHGKESKDFIRELKDKSYKDISIWKALSIYDKKNIKEYFKDDLENKLVDMFLIDGDNPGSGEDYSTQKLKEILEKSNNNIKYFLAGGITPENVSEKIKDVNPFGVDVSSGVEEMTKENIRHKSFKKMKIFIEHVRNIEF